MHDRQASKVRHPTDDCATASAGGWAGRVRQYLRCYRRDVDAVLGHDPAARTRLEVVLTYPGLHALWLHRLAHSLWRRRRVLPARLVSHMNRFVTGVEVHPGATIGQDVFIDHGMGVVIGETAVIGDGCILYKGVVLGGTSTERTVRHPRLGQHVVVGSNACILGAIEIGDGARIGSGSVVIRAVPAGATVVGVPGRIAPSGGRKARFDATLDHANLPDPVASMLRSLRHENEQLLDRVRRLEQYVGAASEQDGDDQHLVDGELATSDLRTPTGSRPPSAD